MGIEIERKFLVKKDLWQSLPKPKGRKLIQGYLLTDPQKTIRIRVDESCAFLTIKGIGTNFSRAEFEYEIPAKDGEEMLRSMAGPCIEKIRYEIEHRGKTWEVDEFLGENLGLIVAEIELDSEDEKFELPPWVDEEVTQDHRYFNAWLSAHPFATWDRK